MAKQVQAGQAGKTGNAKPTKEKGPKGFGFTLRGAAGDTMRVQAKYKGAELHTSVTHALRGKDGKKVRKVGARAVHADKAAAETWMSNIKTKLTGLGWKAKGTAKVDAFGIDSLPAPVAK